MYASKTSFGSPDEGSPSPGPESLYGSRQGLQVEERHQLAVEEQMVEEDENVDEVLEQEAEEQELEPGEGEYLTMASILTVVPSLLAKNDTEEGTKEEEDVEDGGMEKDLEGNLEDKEVEEINRVDQHKKEDAR